MKVKISYTLDLSEDERKAIGLRYGKELGAAATYDQIVAFYHEKLDTVVKGATAFLLRDYYKQMGIVYDTLADRISMPTKDED